MKIPYALRTILLIRPNDKAHGSTKYAIKHYIRSTQFEQCTTYESKHLLNLIADYHSGEMSRLQRLELRNILCTRISLHDRVNFFVKDLGLNTHLPPIEKWQETPRKNEQQKKQQEENEEGKECKDYEEELYFRRIYWMVVESGLLNIPPLHTCHSVLYYQRPARHLASGMCLAGYSEDDFRVAIKRLWRYHDPEFVYVKSHEWVEKRLGCKKFEKMVNYRKLFGDKSTASEGSPLWKRTRRVGDL